MQALRRLFLIVLLILLAAGAVWFYRNRIAPVSTAASAPTQVVTVRQGNLTTNISVVGELDAMQLESLAFSRMNGTAKLVTLEVKTGATVKAGRMQTKSLNSWKTLLYSRYTRAR